MNKTSEKISHFNSNYNLLLINKYKNIKKIEKNKKHSYNVKKKINEKKKSKSNINLIGKKLFDTYDKNDFFSLNNDNKSKNNFGEIISSLKNTLKEIENDNEDKDRFEKIENKINNKIKVHDGNIVKGYLINKIFFH